MTDKVQKIHEEVEKRYEYWKEKESNSHSIESEIRMSECKHLLLMLNFLQEEPVSEDLEEALKYRVKEIFDSLKKFDINDKEKNRVAFGLLQLEGYAKMFYDIGKKAGAQWQEDQFEKNRLKHCNSITNEQAELEQGFIDQHLDKYQRMPTFLDAIEYGMKLEEQQMMAMAVDVTVHIDAGGYPYIPQIELYDYENDIPLAKEGDKYKVVLIKED